MKVKDLIEVLLAQDKNAEVIVDIQEAGEYLDIERIGSYSETGVHIIVNQRDVDE